MSASVGSLGRMAGRPRYRPTETERAIAANAQKARERTKMSQAEVARRIGVTVTTLSRYENARRGIPVPYLLRLQEILGQPIVPGTVLGAAAVARESFAEYHAPPPSLAPSTAEEHQLVGIFRVLPREGKDALLGRAMSLAATAGVVPPTTAQIADSVDS